jgi:multiple sugar transport system substrate-binding protein
VGSVAAAVLATSLAGCTGDDDPSGGPSPSPAASSSAPTPVSLSFGVFGGDATVQAYRDLVQAYTAEHPEVTISLRVSGDADQAARRVRQSTQAGTAPDVFLLDSNDLAGLVGTKTLEPLDELMADRDLQFGDDFQRLGFTAFSADQMLQCMPVEVSPLVVYYDPDAVDLSLLPPDPDDAEDVDPGVVPDETGAGSPTASATEEPGASPSEGADEGVSAENGWSWEQFVAAAQLAAAEGAKGVWIPPDVDVLTPLVRSQGGDVVDDVIDPTTLTLSGDAPVQAMDKVLSLVRNPVLSPTAAQIGAKDALTRFTDRDTAMLLGTRAVLPELRAAGVRFDVMPLPSLGRFRSYSDVTGLCLAAGGAHVSEAADFVAWAVGEEGAAVLARSGAVVPSNIAVLHSGDFLQPARRPRHAEVYAASVVRSDPGPYSAQWPTVTHRTNLALTRLFHDLSIDQATGTLPYLQRLDQRSEAWFAPPEEEP